MTTKERRDKHARYMRKWRASHYPALEKAKRKLAAYKTEIAHKLNAIEIRHDLERQALAAKHAYELEQYRREWKAQLTVLDQEIERYEAADAAEANAIREKQDAEGIAAIKKLRDDILKDFANEESQVHMELEPPGPSQDGTGNP